MPGEAPVGTAGDRGSLLLSQAKHRRDRRGNAAVRGIRLQDAATDPVAAAPMHRTGRTDRRILRMNFPSTEFDDAVTAACQGTVSESDVAALHATLRAHEAARDDYLWQVELHAHLASRALTRTTGPALPGSENLPSPPAQRRARVRWAVAAAAVLIAFLGGLSWQWWNSAANRKDGPNMSDADDANRFDGEGGLALQGWIRPTVS